MTVSKKAPREHRKYRSRPDVQAYLKKYPDATAQEKRDLVKWLKAGQSPATNDCNLCDDRGYPLDFIDARRTEQDLIQQHLMCPDEPEEPLPKSPDDAYELPF
jgi:hypothetical protein